MADYSGPMRVASTSAANALLTLNTTAGKPMLLKAVHVKYSGSVTQNVTVTLDSGAGAAYDVILNTIAISAGTTGVYLPSVPIPVAADDIISVAAPAGGSGVTASVAIYLDRQI